MCLTSGKTMKSNCQLRPRFNREELEFIEYALTILEQLSASKFNEQRDLPSRLKRFVKLVYWTGWTVDNFKVYKQVKAYLECEMQKDFTRTNFNANRLKRRIKGLLKGRKYHSRELLS